MYCYKLTHVENCIITYHHDKNHDLMVVLMCFVVIPDTLEGSTHEGIAGHDNAMSYVDDDCGKSFVIFLRYKNAYHIEETKTVLVREDCS